MTAQEAVEQFLQIEQQLLAKYDGEASSAFYHEFLDQPLTDFENNLRAAGLIEGEPAWQRACQAARVEYFIGGDSDEYYKQEQAAHKQTQQVLQKIGKIK